MLVAASKGKVRVWVDEQGNAKLVASPERDVLAATEAAAKRAPSQKANLAVQTARQAGEG